jgi:hypothetical protein
MIAIVTGVDPERIVRRASIVFWRPTWATHCGHFWPTAASMEQAEQMGRPQSEQARRVWRSGCR